MKGGLRTPLVGLKMAETVIAVYTSMSSVRLTICSSAEASPVSLEEDVDVDGSLLPCIIGCGSCISSSPSLSEGGIIGIARRWRYDAFLKVITAVS